MFSLRLGTKLALASGVGLLPLVANAAWHSQQIAATISTKGAAETGTASSQVLASAKALSSEGSKLNTEVDKFLATVRAA